MNKEKEIELEKKLLMKKNFSIKVLFISILIAVICVAALILIILCQEINNSVEIILTTILSTILASATLSILWEVAMKRSFLQEILIKTNLSKNIELYGIERVEKDFSKIDFDDYLAKTKSLKMVVIYGTNTLTNNKYTNYWKKLDCLYLVHAAKDDETIDKLVKRFAEYSKNSIYDKNRIKTKIEDAISTVKILRNNGVTINEYSNKNMIYSSYYLFDEYAIIANFPHMDKNEGTSLSLICKKGGILYKYVEDEVNSIIENSELMK